MFKFNLFIKQTNFESSKSNSSSLTYFTDLIPLVLSLTVVRGIGGGDIYIIYMTAHFNCLDLTAGSKYFLVPSFWMVGIWRLLQKAW